METLFTARLAILVLVLLIALYTDISQRKIYDWLTLPAIGLGVGFTIGEIVLFNHGPALGGLLFGLIITSIIFGVPTWLGWLGGGDFKLMLGVTALLGGRMLLQTLFCVSLFGAVMAFVMLIWKGRFFKGLSQSLRLIIKPKSASIHSEGELTIPYGVAISLGTLCPVIFLFLGVK